MGETEVQALRGVDLDIHQGEMVAIMGASGSGKSTFMNLLGCLDRPTSGTYLLDGIEVDSMTPDEQADVRSEKIGFIFQGFNLLPRMTALENVCLPMTYSGAPIGAQRHVAERALILVGLGDRLDHRPSQLSGGQQQRVAIARSLVNDPAMILADEPTGNLDSKTTLEILQILQNLNIHGKTIIMVTHEADVARYASRVVSFMDGVVMDDRANERQMATSASVIGVSRP